MKMLTALVCTINASDCIINAELAFKTALQLSCHFEVVVLLETYFSVIPTASFLSALGMAENNCECFSMN